VSGVFTALADVVAVAHFVYLAVLVFGGLAAWRWPRLTGPHLVAVVWGVGAITIGYDCPLTSLEQYLRVQAGHGLYRGSFIRHYIRGVLYPEWLTPFVMVAMIGLVVTGWVGLVGLTRRRGWSRRLVRPASPS
jgi:hypothetical protein